MSRVPDSVENQCGLNFIGELLLLVQSLTYVTQAWQYGPVLVLYCTKVAQLAQIYDPK